MSLLKHPFAYLLPDKEVVLVSQAIKGEKYVDFRGDVLIFKKGEVKQPHFSYKAGYNPIFDVNQSAYYERGAAGTAHTIIIQSIARNGYIDFDNKRFIASKVVVEKATIPNSRLIPDITFYDEEGEILMCVEVVVTHFCGDKKIEELKRKSIPTLEIEFYEDGDYQNPKSGGFISSTGLAAYESREVIESRNKEKRRKIKRLDGEIETFKKEGAKFNKDISRQVIQGKDKDYFRDEVRKAVKFEVDFFKERLDSIRKDIKLVGRAIEETKSQEKEIRNHVLWQSRGGSSKKAIERKVRGEMEELRKDRKDEAKYEIKNWKEKVRGEYEERDAELRREYEKRKTELNNEVREIREKRAKQREYYSSIEDEEERIRRFEIQIREDEDEIRFWRSLPSREGFDENGRFKQPYKELEEEERGLEKEYKGFRAKEERLIRTVQFYEQKLKE